MRKERVSRQIARKTGFVGAWRAMPLLIFALFLSACGVMHTPITRIALLAPFEGRYREIGYNALYAARLALADAADPQIELLPIDAGGDQAAERARALSLDPQVKTVILLGYEAT